MARVINAEIIQASLFLGLAAAGALGVKTTINVLADSIEARDRSRLAQVIGDMNLSVSPITNSSAVSEKFARQIAMAVFPSITDNHLRQSYAASSTFFVKSPDGFNESVPVVLAFSRTHSGGTYVRVQHGRDITDYNCKFSHNLFVDAGIGSVRDKGHIGNVFSNCTDISTPLHIAASDGKTGAITGIPQVLRDEIVSHLSTEQLFAPGIVTANVAGNTIALRREETPEYITATRPYARINGHTLPCQLALKASSVTVSHGRNYSDRSERSPPEAVVTVYHCTVG